MDNKCETCKHCKPVKSPMVQYDDNPAPWPLYGNELADYCWVGQIPRSVEGLNITACDVYEKEEKKPGPRSEKEALEDSAKRGEAPASPNPISVGEEAILKELEDIGAETDRILLILHKHFK